MPIITAELEFPTTVEQASFSRRFFEARFANPRLLPDEKYIVFEQEDLMIAGAKSMHTLTDAVSSLIVSGREFAIFDPKSGDATGEVATHDDFYRILYSMYRSLI